LRFWDTSSIVPLLVNEPQSATMKNVHSADTDLVTWWGTRPECISALNRRRREGELSSQEVADARVLLDHLSNSWAEMQPTDRVRSLAERFMDTHPLKAADALQLAAAFRWAAEHPVGHEFVSLDGTLRRAAEAEGFTVLP
jgi:predicted nucleic acid-binding protein